MHVLGSGSPFVVFSLPRSRSAWASLFLSYGGAFVGHDIAIDCGRPEDFIEQITGKFAGTCETGAMVGWRLIRRYLPTCKFAVIRRRRADVVASLGRFGLTGFEDEMERRDALLDEITALPGTLSLTFSDMETSTACAMLFEFCLERPFDPRWWLHLSQMNVQVDMRKTLQRLYDNHNRIEILKTEVGLRQANFVGGGECRKSA